jgi:hypothetical protein
MPCGTPRASSAKSPSHRRIVLLIYSRGQRARVSSAGAGAAPRRGAQATAGGDRRLLTARRASDPASAPECSRQKPPNGRLHSLLALRRLLGGVRGRRTPRARLFAPELPDMRFPGAKAHTIECRALKRARYTLSYCMTWLGYCGRAFRVPTGRTCEFLGGLRRKVAQGAVAPASFKNKKRFFAGVLIDIRAIEWHQFRFLF